MKRIFVVYSNLCSQEAHIVANMCRNSFSALYVCMAEYDKISQIPSMAILLEPPDEFFSTIKYKTGKYVVLGRLSGAGQEWFNVREKLDYCDSVVLHWHDGVQISDYYIKYQENDLWALRNQVRSLIRYDYADEWNNHGYGKIGLSGSSFDVSMYAEDLGETSIADNCAMICKAGEEDTCFPFIKKRDEKNSSFVWINRLVGMADSYEWNLVETFFADYRFDELPCLPYVLDVPGDYEGAVTMRLDCDQAICTARKLWEMYCDEHVPMSLAITTGNAIGAEDFSLITDVIGSGGSILSHSMNHFPDWGGNYYGAYMEALGSKLWLNRHVGEPFLSHVYAVSPFHQNSGYAVAAMEDAGYRGFVSGSIHNNPECVLARGGHVSGFKTIISLSNQCMLHGDCYHSYGNTIEPYTDSLDFHFEYGNVFGYLDHPFSEAYQYGWNDEDERIDVHQNLIHYAKNKGNIWFCNLHEALDFIYGKTRLEFYVNDEDRVVSNGGEKLYRYCVRYKNRQFVI